MNHQIILEQKSILKLLKKISEELKAEYNEFYGCAWLKIDNEIGKGTIWTFDIFPGMSVIIFDITFKADFSFQFEKDAISPMYFVFCNEGNLKQKFAEEDEFTDINKNKNVILKGISNGNLTIDLPKDTPLKISFIAVTESRIPLEETNKRPIISHYLNDLFSSIVDDIPFRFIGNYSLTISNLVSILIKSKKEGLVGRLLIEGIALQILASQVEAHDEETSTSKLNFPLKEDEFTRVLKSSEYIAANLSKNLKVNTISKTCGLTEKKLQIGYRYLFHKSVNKYILEARLEKTREMIETTNLTISEILYANGLNNRSYFSKKFKERYGILPSEYKNTQNG